jgi:hypothetical protein
MNEYIGHEKWMDEYIGNGTAGTLYDIYKERQSGGHPHRTIGERTVREVTGLGQKRGSRLARYVMEEGANLFGDFDPDGLQRVTPHNEDEPIEELLDRREGAFERKWRSRNQEVVVKVHETKPFGILVMGDAHIDSDGCDIGLLRKHVKIIQDTDGMYGAQVGDFHNNWVGRLVEQYAHQSSTRAEAIRLVEWYLSSVEWAWINLGNHCGQWRDGAELMPLLLRSANVAAVGKHDVKLRLEADGCEPIRIWSRHQFRGRSMYHKVQGLLRAIRENDYPADVYLQGHHHSFGDMRGERASGKVWTVCQVGTYKKADDYADQLGYEPDDNGQAYLLILNPWAQGISRVFGTFDIENGVRYLAHLRSTATTKEEEVKDD